MAGGMIYALSPIFFYATNTTRYVPGILGISLAVGSLLFSISFSLCPEMHMVLLKKSSDLKIKYMMDEIFFHDLLNTATVLSTSASLLNEYNSEEQREELLELVMKGIENLNNAIKIQRIINMAEHGKLVVSPEKLDCSMLLKEISELFRP